MGDRCGSGKDGSGRGNELGRALVVELDEAGDEGSGYACRRGCGMIPLGVDEVERKMDGVAGMEATTTLREVKTSGLGGDQGG